MMRHEPASNVFELTSCNLKLVVAIKPATVWDYMAPEDREALSGVRLPRNQIYTKIIGDFDRVVYFYDGENTQLYLGGPNIEYNMIKCTANLCGVADVVAQYLLKDKLGAGIYIVLFKRILNCL